MREIIREDQEFVREELPSEQAVALLEHLGEPFKAEYARELVATHALPPLSFYRNGPFLDMCRGPHVAVPRICPLTRSACDLWPGRYWRGDEHRPMMTRIDAWCFENRQELEEQVAAFEARLANDHKRLGPALDLYALDPLIGKGLPLWLPAGTVIREELEKLAREEEFKRDYQRVATPHITRGELYRMSGHLSHYLDKKVREAELRKIPNLVIVGSREQQDAQVTLRCHGDRRQRRMGVRVFRDGLLSQIRNRTLTPNWDECEAEVIAVD